MNFKGTYKISLLLFVTLFIQGKNEARLMEGIYTYSVGHWNEAVDTDGDGIEDDVDNCPTTANPLQENNDGDAEGDICDTDDDNDGILDIDDPCPFTTNSQNYALDFDGSSDFVRFENTFPFHQAGNKTLEFWVLKRSNTDRSILWTRGNSTDANRYNIGTSTNGVFFDYRAPNGSISGHTFGTTGAFPTGTWTHIALVRSGNVYSKYLNGVLVGMATDANPALPNAVQWTLSGRDCCRFTGQLDELRLWDYARSEAEIQSDMNRMLSGNEAGLIGYWNFDQGAGTQLTDQTAQGNHGTIFNGPNWVVSNAPIVAEDADGDGFCSFDDCDDTDPAIYPGAVEVCNGIDDNCDGLIDEDVTLSDADGDGICDEQDNCPADPNGLNAGLEFDGINDYVNIPDHPSLDISGEITVEAWIFLEGSTGTNQNIIRKNDNFLLGYIAWPYDKIEAQLHYPNATPGTWFKLPFSKPPSWFENQWVHIAFTYKSGAFTLYLNGKVDNFSSQLTGPVNTTNSPLQFSSVSFAISQFFNGKLDEVRVWNKVRTPEEIADNLFQELTGSESGLVGYWPLNEASGIQIIDQSSNSNNGTLINGPNWFSSQKDVDEDGVGDLCDDCPFDTVNDGDQDGFCASEDCNDNDPNVYPGAQEVCNGIDDDCDGLIDQADPDFVPGQELLWYADNDGDGFGISGDTQLSCEQPDGYVALGGDCNDTNPDIYPGAPEICNGLDDDCDGLTDDDDPDISGQPTWYADADGDGFGNPNDSQTSCIQPNAYVASGGDCNDNDPAIYPGATETCNGIDDDCDGQTDEGVLTTFYADTDGDGFGDPVNTIQACEQPEGYVTDNTDCDDSNNAIYPGAIEICNGLDDDCDGLTDDEDPDLDLATRSIWYADEDGDGFGDINITQMACDQPVGFVNNAADCNDNNADIHPDAVEICNGIDDDCDGLIDDEDPGISDQMVWYADGDGDGFGDPNTTLTTCNQPDGYLSIAGDCDDTDPNVYALDCNGVCGGPVVDIDEDGICSDVDCNDNDPEITTKPGDPCNDGDNTTINDTIDENCNCVGTPTACTGIGDADNDGVCADVDCDDNDPNAGFLDCNGVCGGPATDNDGDGVCSDLDCDDNNPNVQDPPTQGPAGLLPASGSLDLDNMVLVSWQPVQYANRYDLYLWNANNPEPSNPTVANLTQINYLFSNLGYGVTYNWKVVAKIKACESPPSSTQTFTIRRRPDLQVADLQTPGTAFSGQQISLDWVVENTGAGGTYGQSWSDVFYLSEDESYNASTDYTLGSVANLSALDAGESYANSASFTLPQGIEGTYYILAYTDRFSQEIETNEGNNLRIQTVDINLTPPPDLQVTSVVAPQNSLSGEYISVSWTVSNEGTGSTLVGQWEDRVFLSESTVFNQSSAIYLGKANRNGELLPGQNYTRSGSYRIPQFIEGTHYVHVVTDYKNAVYESALENNNANGSNPLNVILVTPPDLLVTNIAAPGTVSNNEFISISWTVMNQTNTPTNDDFWADQVFISPTVNFNENTAIKLHQAPNMYHSGVLGFQESYTQSFSARIPKAINGSWYILVRTDVFNNVDEFTFEGNNSLAIPIEVLSPDLTPTDITHATEAFSGEKLNVQWNEQNIGPGAMIAQTWESRFYLSSDAVFDPATDIKADSATVSGSFSGGTSDANTYDIFIPNGLNGTYYLFILSDADNQVFENGNNGNNVSQSPIPINITLSEWADLQVSSVQAPADIVAGFSFTLDYSVQNASTVTTKDSVWVDRVYISSSPTWSGTGATLLGTFNHNSRLDPGESYSVSRTVNLPINTPAGARYLHLFTDATNREYEHTDEDNNTANTSVQVEAYPPVDLAITSATGPAGAASGTNIALQWTVENQGEAVTLSNNWYDHIYLSSDPTFSGNDLLLKQQSHYGVVGSGGQYQVNISLNLPNGLSGNYYLIIIADKTGSVADVNRSNNQVAINNGAPITISLTPPPDLIVANMSLPTQVTAGQPFSVSYTIQNDGSGNALPISWQDRFLLSSDPTFGNSGDQPLAASLNKSPLGPGTSYTGSIQLTVPASISGNYFILLKTDGYNVVYEHGQESNNVYSVPIIVEQPPPSDLLVSSITLADTAIAGEQTIVSWELSNEGQNVAKGVMSEAVYLSRDTEWDINDPLIGIRKGNIHLLPGQTTGRSFTADLTGVSLGEYYAIIRTDILDNIYESDETNNIRVSESTIYIDVKTLEIGVEANDVLTDFKALYYKIEVPADLFEESLIVSLKGDSINGYNELYIRYNEVPTRVEYDEAYDLPFYGNQEVIVSSLLPGTYYLMVYGQNSDVVLEHVNGSLQYVDVTTQDITLLAEILNFEIRSVDADQGGNTGDVTVEIKGAKFDEAMSIHLTNTAGDTITATNVNLIDPTLAYVTFDLLDAEVGTYNVIGINGVGDTAVVADGFEVVAGGEPSLSVVIHHAESVPRRRIITFEIAFANDGNVDLIDPRALLTSMAGAPVSLTQADLSANLQELELTLQEFNGPPGLLRPGAGGVITVYTQSVAPLGFLVAYLGL